MYRYLIIGNGVAGTTAAESIRQRDVKGEIVVVSAEDLPFYYRIRLPDVLSGEITEPDLIARKKKWYDEKNIVLKLNTEITQTNPDKKTVLTSDDSTLTYDKLLLANGSSPFIPPIKGTEINGVFALQTINDVRKISRFAEKANDVVLIGGGLLGLEAANALHKLEKRVTVVEFFPRLLPRQLDIEGAARLQRFFEKLNFEFKLGVTTKEIAGVDRAEQVILQNGERIPTDMVIISAGVRPNLKLARMLDLETARGVIVNNQLQTSNPDIYAAGDVIELDNCIFGIWPAAMEQGKVAGTNISGGSAVYEGTPMLNILKVAGIDLASAGNIDENNQYESIVVATDTVYKKAVIDNEKVIGCIMLGDRKNFNRISKAIASGEDITDDLPALLQS